MKKYSVIVLVIIVAILGCSSFVKADNYSANDEYYNISRAQDYFDRQQYEECIKYSTMALTVDNNNIAALYLKGKSLFNFNRYNEAAEYLDKVLVLDPMHAGALCDRGLIYAVNHNKDSAESYLTKAIAIDPGYSSEASSFLKPWSNPEWENFIPIATDQVYLDGELLSLDIWNDMDHGRTLAPVRGFFEALGAEVQWDNDTKTITAIKDNTVVSMQINNSIAKINNNEQMLDLPATIYDGKTYVPLRFAAEAFGAKVEAFFSGTLIYITTPDTITKLSQEEQDKIINRLETALDYVPIEGVYANPNSLYQNEAILNMIANNSDDLSAFLSLSDNNKKKLMFAYVKNNLHIFAGYKTVNVFFVYDNQKYAHLQSNTQNNSIDPLYVFKNGMDANVVVQDISKNKYYYYGNRPTISMPDSSDWVTKEIILDKQYTISYPKQWTVLEKEGIITIVPPSKDAVKHGVVQIELKRITNDEANEIDQAGGFLGLNKNYILNKLNDSKIVDAQWVPEDKFCAKDYSQISEYLLDFTFKDNDGNNLRGCTRFFINENGSNLFCNLISENNNYYYEYKPLFNKIINSMKIH